MCLALESLSLGDGILGLCGLKVLGECLGALSFDNGMFGEGLTWGMFGNAVFFFFLGFQASCLRGGNHSLIEIVRQLTSQALFLPTRWNHSFRLHQIQKPFSIQSTLFQYVVNHNMRSTRESPTPPQRGIPTPSTASKANQPPTTGLAVKCGGPSAYPPVEA